MWQPNQLRILAVGKTLAVTNHWHPQLVPSKLATVLDLQMLSSDPAALHHINTATCQILRNVDLGLARLRNSQRNKLMPTPATVSV